MRAFLRWLALPFKRRGPRLFTQNDKIVRKRVDKVRAAQYDPKQFRRGA